MVVVTLAEGTADELASMVTVPPGGMEAGAMKVVGCPLAVCRVIEPHWGTGAPQVKSQPTPRFSVSFVTVAANWTVEFVATDDGGAICPWAKAMVVGPLFVPPPHPAVSRVPHKTNRSSFGLESLVCVRKADSQFI
jgi:hypothetical protein